MDKGSTVGTYTLLSKGIGGFDSGMPRDSSFLGTATNAHRHLSYLLLRLPKYAQYVEETRCLLLTTGYRPVLICHTKAIFVCYPRDLLNVPNRTITRPCAVHPR